MKAVATFVLDVPDDKDEAQLETQISTILKTWTVWPAALTQADSVKVLNVEKIKSFEKEPPLQAHVAGRTVYALFGEGADVRNAFSLYVGVAPGLPDDYAEQVAGRLAYSWNALKTLPLPHLHASDLSVVPPEEPYGHVKEQRDEALAVLADLVSEGYVSQKDVKKVRRKIQLFNGL